MSGIEYTSCPDVSVCRIHECLLRLDRGSRRDRAQGHLQLLPIDVVERFTLEAQLVNGLFVPIPVAITRITPGVGVLPFQVELDELPGEALVLRIVIGAMLADGLPLIVAQRLPSDGGIEIVCLLPPASS